MRSGAYTVTSLSDHTKYRCPSNLKVVRILSEPSLVRLAEHLGGRRSYCPQRQQTGWTVGPVGHARLDGQCVTGHNLLSGLAQRH